MLRNLTDTRYNGFNSTIQDICEEGPLVDFPTSIVQILRNIFDSYNHLLLYQ
jgi:hypothetical protein